MKYLFIVLIVFVSYTSFSQKTYQIDVTIDGFPSSQLYLADFYGDKNNVFDTLFTNPSGHVGFLMDDSRPAGMYRIFITQNDFLDFIFNKENIVLTTNVKAPMDSLKVISSVENKLYYDFLRAERTFMTKLELLSPLLSYFPQDDEFYNTARIKFLRVQQERDSYLLDKKKEYPDAYATKILQFQRNPNLPASLSDIEKSEFIKTHFFDKVDFSDPDLLRSDVYPNKIISFLTLYSNRNIPQEKLEENFISAIDNLMSRPFDNIIVKEYIIKYLISGFEKYGFEKVILHIASTYNDNTCENEERKSDLQTRLDNYKKLAIGKIGPDISIPDMNGNLVELKNIQTKYVMLIFWATWCPHCSQMLPEIYNLYKNQTEKNVEVIAISIDEDADAWNNFLAKNNFTWINASDLKGWNGKTTIDYNIYATPTIIVLDQNRQILSKPLTMAGIHEEFKRK